MSVDCRTWDAFDRVIGLRGVTCGKRAYLLEDIVGSFKIRQHAREKEREEWREGENERKGEENPSAERKDKYAVIRGRRITGARLQPRA